MGNLDSKWYHLDEQTENSIGMSRHNFNISLWINVLFFPLGLVKLFEIIILIINHL